MTGCDLNEKFVEPLTCFDISIPRKSTSLGPNSHVSAESSIFTPLREGDLETLTERAGMAGQELGTTGIETVPLPQGI